ncbi:MAG: DUF4390 domain-containing protein [Thermoanaerobaculia bacterium]|nr:DUF4390 domain-containing protein [Thermoanaerobaculia bacterium]
MHHRRGTSLLFAAALFCAAAGRAGAQEPAGPRINILKPEARGADVFLQFNVTGALNPELARKIEAGLETAIRYEIRLYRRYPYWIDESLDLRRYRVAVTYDPVTQEYVVNETLDGKPLRRTTTRDFAEAARRLVSREDLLVFHVGRNKPRRNLYVMMRGRFDTGFLFTIIPVDSKTPWKKSRRFNVRETP